MTRKPAEQVALEAAQAAALVWREAHPGPLIWVTTLKKGRTFVDFTPAQPDDLPIKPHRYYYVGRTVRNWMGSALANPFRLNSEEERSAVIEQYRAWLWERFRPGTPQWSELMEILRLSLRHGGVCIACWCAPKSPCHGDVVREAVLQMYAAGWRGDE